MSEKYEITHYIDSNPHKRLLAFWSEGFALGSHSILESEYELYEWSEINRIEIIYSSPRSEKWSYTPPTLVEIEYVELTPPKSTRFNRKDFKNSLKMRTEDGEIISIAFERIDINVLVKLIQTRLAVNEEGVLLTLEAKLSIREDLRQALKYAVRKPPPIRGNNQAIFPSDTDIEAAVPEDVKIEAIAFGTLVSSMNLNPLNKMASYFVAWVMTEVGLFTISKGHLFAAETGRESNFIPLSKLGGIALKTNRTLLGGFNSLTTQGMQSEEEITWVVKGSAEYFIKKTRDVMLNQGKQPILGRPKAQDDLVSQIRGLAELLEEGLLTQSEFDEQKLRLLKDK